MQERIITIYCLCDEFLKARGFVEYPWTRMSTAEVMTRAVVAAELFGGCFERSRTFLTEQGYIPHRLSKSRFNRRLPAIPEHLWPGLFHLLSEAVKHLNTSGESILDSCPVPGCDTIRIRRCHHLLPRHAVLQPGNIDPPGAEVYILPQQQPHLGGAETEIIHRAKEGAVAQVGDLVKEEFHFPPGEVGVFLTGHTRSDRL